MATKTVADLLVQTLAAAGVERVYGVSGDSLNGITDSIRRQKQIQWIHMPMKRQPRSRPAQKHI